MDVGASEEQLGTELSNAVGEMEDIQYMSALSAHEKLSGVGGWSEGTPALSSSDILYMDSLHMDSSYF